MARRRRGRAGRRSFKAGVRRGKRIARRKFMSRFTPMRQRVGRRR